MQVLVERNILTRDTSTSTEHHFQQLLEKLSEMTEVEETETDQHLRQLFEACDIDGSGYIGIEEVREICGRIGATESDADEVFTKLDKDGDGRVSFEDFRAGFDDYEKGAIVASTPLMSPNPGKSYFSFHEEESIESSKILSRVTPPVLKKVQANKTPRKESLLQVCLNGREMESNEIVRELIEKINKLKEDNSLLSKSLEKDKHEYEDQLKELEAEMDHQVKQVEVRVKQKAEQELEAERKSVREVMKEEMDELHAHMQMFQKVDSWLKANQSNKDDERVNEYRQKLEEAIQENRQMRYSLLDTQTTISLMRSDLSQIRGQYEQKCKELEKEREKVIVSLQEQEHLSRQVHLLQDVNRRLQDTNDMRSETSETSSSLERKRGSILGDYIVTPRREVCRDKDIVEEVDSGHSSNLRDEDNYRHSWKDRVSVILPPQPLLNVHCLASYPRSKSCDCLYQKPECRSTCKTASQTTPAEDMYIIAPNQRPDRTFKVIFIGDAGVGKSSFILRILRNEFIPVLSSTLGVDFSVQTVLVNGCIVSLQLWDTAGQERFRSITRTYFRKADGVMLLYDVSNEQSFLNVRKWVHDIEEQTDHPIPVVIVGNKTDLRDGIQETQGKSFVSSQDGCKMSLETNSTFLEVSVKNGDGVSSALVSLIRKMMFNEDSLVGIPGLKLTEKDKAKSMFGCCSR